MMKWKLGMMMRKWQLKIIKNKKNIILQLRMQVKIARSSKKINLILKTNLNLKTNPILKTYLILIVMKNKIIK